MAYDPYPCRANRGEVEKSVIWLNNVEVFLDEGDEGYDEQQHALEVAYGAAISACKNKPRNCGLEMTDDSTFECEQCDFSSHIQR